MLADNVGRHVGVEGSETDHRVLLLGSCDTSSGFLDGRGETLDRVLLNCHAIGTAYKRRLTTLS